ncbi:hypothetical protein EK21DRAFT_94866 [Setomelanomma holmii]|uniref:Uncharacterized protein n=1 Tax=Setomelanomma holmii TaxID=210430 RepID=A0A9P4GXV0_9PLEO|nr:hypothetical protein EK21DRAFT_94866 [Setomelanomma holmii]
MQERELARRTQHFFRDEVEWHCAHMTACECGICPLWNDYRISTLGGVREYESCKTLPDETPFFGGVWVDVIEEYSRLDLTYVGDTLPALSGLAKRVEIFKPGRYIAGLWGKDIAYLLAWNLAPNEENTHPLRTQAAGPSFSWIKAPRRVDWPYWSRDDPIKIMGKLQSVDCDLATANPYGEVLACSIQLRSRVICGRIFNDLVTEALAKYMETNPMSYGRFTDAEWGNVRRTWEDVVYLELYQVYKGKHVMALLLQKEAGERNVCTRLGVINRAPARWFDEHGVEEVITVV